MSTGWRGRRASGPDAERTRMVAFSEASARALRVLDMEIERVGTPPEGVVLLSSNHLSYLDPVAIAAVVPCVPISKADLASWPIFGAAAEATGVLFVNRGDSGSRFGVIRAAEGVLQSGRSVLNFPEGTTTIGDRVLPLRPGLFGAVRRLGVPVAPVAIRYDPPELAWIGDDTFVPHFVQLVRRRRARVRLAFGAPIASAGFPTAAALAEAVHASMSGLLQEATPWRKTQP